MPAIANGAVNSATDSFGGDATWTDAGATSGALAIGEWLCVGMANNTNDGDGSLGVELEFRHGTTRVGYHRFRQVNGGFNIGEDAKGGIACTLARVTGDGSAALNMRRQAPNGYPGGGEQRVGGQQWQWLSLDDLGTEDVDWFWSESANTDTVNVTPTGTTWTRAAGTTDRPGELTITPSATENWVFLASVESVPGSGATGEAMRVRLRLVEDPAGTPIETTIGHGGELEYTLPSTPQEFGENYFQPDVQPLTSGTTYRVQWEVANNGGSNVGWRRFRIFAAPASSFAGFASIDDAGDIEVVTGELDGANDLAINFSASAHDVWALTCCTHQNGGNWGQTYLRHTAGPTDYPASGHLRGQGAAGLTAGDDFVDAPHAASLQGVSGAQTLRLVGQCDGGVTCTYGRNRGNTASQRTVLVALQMETPASGGVTEWSSTGTQDESGGSSQIAPPGVAEWSSTATQTESDAVDQVHAAAWSSTATEAESPEVDQVHTVALDAMLLVQAATGGSSQLAPGAVAEWSTTATQDESDVVTQRHVTSWGVTATQAESGGSSQIAPIVGIAWSTSALQVESQSVDQVHVLAWSVQAPQGATGGVDQVHAVGWSATAVQAASGASAVMVPEAVAAWASTATQAESPAVDQVHVLGWGTTAVQVEAGPISLGVGSNAVLTLDGQDEARPWRGERRYVREGDEYPAILDTVLDDLDELDLTSATLAIRLRHTGTGALLLAGTVEAGTPATGTDGVRRVALTTAWGEGELDAAAAVYHYTYEAAWPDGRTQTMPTRGYGVLQVVGLV